MNKLELKELARKIRIHIIEMIATAGSGHPGGSLSAVELMVGLYFNQLQHKCKEPEWKLRDLVIFSKGHASALLYAILAEAGYFPREDLLLFRKLGSLLQGHPSRNGLPGVEISTGSLGQGLSVGLGMALGLIQQENYLSNVYVLVGDGECNCGQIWEAAMAAAHYKIDNLCVVLDYNQLQIDGTTKEVMNLSPIAKKWKSFGWNVIDIDGHNFNQIQKAYIQQRKTIGKPTIIIGKTIKGKGVSFMENQVGWHGKTPNADQTQQALKELGANV